MTALNRIRIILFALMIFGAFANFALNEWGLDVIKYGELALTISFLAEYGLVLFQRLKNNDRRKLSRVQIILLCGYTIFNLVMIIPPLMGISMIGFALMACWGLIFLIVVGEAIYDLIKRKDNRRSYENFFLAMFFYGLYFKNNMWPGASAVLVFSGLFLLPYYVITTIQFFMRHVKSGKSLVSLLTIGCVSTIFLSLTHLFKTMHWPFGNQFFYVGFTLTLVMIIGTFKWKYNFNNQSISVIQGLKMFKTHIILVYFMVFVFMVYRYLAIKQVAPDFYSQFYPKAVYQMRESGLSSSEDQFKYGELINAYHNFLENSRKNGFSE
jgi:hypothetical protein